MTKSNDVQRFFLYGEEARDALRFIHVETLATRLVLHDWEIRPHRHGDLHHLILVLSGVGEMRVEFKRLPFRGPALLGIPAAMVHGFSFSPGTEGWVLTVSTDFLNLALVDLQEVGLEGIRAEPLLMNLSTEELDQRQLGRQFDEIAAEFRWPELGRGSAIAARFRLLLVTLARLRRVQGIRQDLPEGADSVLFGRFRQLVETGYTGHRPVSAYAADIGVSSKRLNAVCRRVAGCSASQVLHARVLLEARRYLAYSNMTISQVGYALGFNDPAYFSRFFSLREGLPPQDFRLRCRAEESESAIRP
ncbi:MAG: helix-turn-helix domain-containing protein [Aquisalimonadaceae bacterium]